MGVMTEVFDLLKHEPIEDILNIGYIDRDDDISRFIPSLNILFLEFKSKYLKLQRLQNTDFEIHISIVEKNEIINEKNSSDIYIDYEFGISSLCNMFFYEHRKNMFITKMEAYSLSETDYNNGIVKSIGFEVEGNSYVFFDPISCNNIEIGKREERDSWLESITQNTPNPLIDYDICNLIYKQWDSKQG